METGKLSTTHLTSLLDRFKGAKRPEVILAGKPGEDCSYVKIGATTLVLSTDPVTAAESDLGTIAFHINMNDIATSGAEGIGLLVTVLLPPGTEFSVVETAMSELHELCLSHDIAILGGHTEVTDSVTRPVLSVTAVGSMPAGQEIFSFGLKAGDALIVSKSLGIEGTLILADLFPDTARQVLTKDELTQIGRLREQLSVIPEGRTGRRLQVHSMHDITEGGVLGAVSEVAQGSGLGCILNEAAFPFSSATKKLSQALELDPNRLISSGSMLFATDEPARLIAALREGGIASAVIGQVTREKELLLLKQSGEAVPVEPGTRDEIYRVFENQI